MVSLWLARLRLRRARRQATPPGRPVSTSGDIRPIGLVRASLKLFRAFAAEENLPVNGMRKQRPLIWAPAAPAEDAKLSPEITNHASPPGRARSEPCSEPAPTTEERPRRSRCGWCIT